MWGKLGELEKAVCGGGGCTWEELYGGSCVGETVGELCFIHASDPFTEVFNMLLCGMFQ